MIKHRYQLSLKASSQKHIQSNLPNADIALQVTDIMDYLESAKAHEEKGHIYLKEKITAFYRKHPSN